MRYTKEINFDESRVRFISSVGIKSVAHLIFCALLSAGAAVLLAVLTFGGSGSPETHEKIIFGVLTAVLGIILISSVWVVWRKLGCR